MTYPAFGSPAFVDWVDYKARLARADPQAFAHEALARAGDHTLWFVTSPGIHHASGRVPDAVDAVRRVRAPAPVRVGPDERIFEHPGLQEFPAGAAGERLIDGAVALRKSFG